MSEPAEQLPESRFADAQLAELHLGEPVFADPFVEEPLFAGPAVDEPLFADPVIEPLSPPEPELAAVPWWAHPHLPGPVSVGSESIPAEPIPAELNTAEPIPAQPTQPRTAQPRVQAGRVVSGRGVTGRGVVVLILILTGVVGVLEVALAGHRGAAFAITFILTSAIGALVVRRSDLATSLIAPPLLYCILIAVLSFIDTHDQSGGFVTRKAVYIGNAFVTGAPTLWAGTAAAATIVWYRHRANRKPRS